MPLPPAKNFLVLGSNDDVSLLLTRTLRRVFPGSAIAETEDVKRGLHFLQTCRCDAIVAYRPITADVVTLVQRIRKSDPAIPVIAVLSVDYSAEVIAAGATTFLKVEEWLLIGSRVDDVLAHAVPVMAG